MIHYLEYDSDGRLYGFGTCQAEVLATRQENSEFTVIEFPHPVTSLETSYWFDGAVRDMPTRPGPSWNWDYPNRCWALDNAHAWRAVRADRARRLSACDWTTLVDVPLSAEQRDAWAIYRQNLRDITNQTDPEAVVWPMAPL